MFASARKTAGKVLRALIACAALVHVSAPTLAMAGRDDPVIPPELKHVNVTEHLGGQVPLDLIFKDETGKPIRLSQIVDGSKPILLTFAYHSCRTICSMVLNGVEKALENVGWSVGKEFDVITISIDPHDSPALNVDKRDAIVGLYRRPTGPRGWHFLLGDESAIARATASVGYEYSFDAAEKQFAHPAVIMLLSPKGKVTRYLYGIEYSPTDLKLGLIEASEGQAVSSVERAIMYCYRYDPKDGKYVVVATRIMQVGGATTAALFASFLSVLWLREARQKPKVTA